MLPVAVSLTVLSLAAYASMMLLFARALLRRRTAQPRSLDRASRVTIFKPLAGFDDDLDENLASFARLDYPSFEILFGVASTTDPALAAARRFAAAHPSLDVRVAITDPDAAINPKVAQLASLEPLASGDVYVISDSNVRVSPGYLWSLVAELEDPVVGMVTSLFAGTGERSLGAALENLQLCASSAPGLVAMDAVSDRPFTVGKSMAMRRRDLARVGGFLSVGDVLAEDHALGRRFLDAGFAARTSLDLIENRNVGCTVGRTVERHTRWSKLRRSLHPFGFFAEPLLNPIVVASLGVLLSPGKVTAAVLIAVCLVQTAAALGCVRLLRGNWLSWRFAPLEFVRSWVSMVCWMRACVSKRIEWRGHVFLLKRGSVIVPLSAAGHRSPGRARLAA
jgi:ceramide glucosyltransferase